jgi:heterotetrameric sarcosine oxidase gamma subunit
MKLQSRSAFGATFGVSTPVPEFDVGERSVTRGSATDAPPMPTKLLERADIGCLLVTTTLDSSTWAAQLRAVVGLEFPLEACRITEAHPHRVLWLTPRSWLIHCPVDDESALATRINDAFPNKSVHAVLFTDYLCWFELSGPKAFDLLSEGGFVSLERTGLVVGHAKRTALAGVAVVLLHERVQTWLIGVERSRAIYIADWLRASGRHCAKIASCGSVVHDSVIGSLK